MKFEEGDKVIIHRPKKSEGFPFWSYPMNPYDGFEGTVEYYVVDHVFSIKGCTFVFDDDWAELINEIQPDEDIKFF